MSTSASAPQDIVNPPSDDDEIVVVAEVAGSDKSSEESTLQETLLSKVRKTLTMPIHHPIQLHTCKNEHALSNAEAVPRRRRKRKRRRNKDKVHETNQEPTIPGFEYDSDEPQFLAHFQQDPPAPIAPDPTQSWLQSTDEFLKRIGAGSSSSSVAKVRLSSDQPDMDIDLDNPFSHSCPPRLGNRRGCNLPKRKKVGQV